MTDQLIPIPIPNPPAIPGLVFRHFRGPQDIPFMVEILNTVALADRTNNFHTLEGVANAYAHMTDCDPYQDMIFIEVGGSLAGYYRCSYTMEEGGDWRYMSFGFLRHEFRRRGIGTVCMAWLENRMRAVASSHPAGGKKHFAANSYVTESGKIALLEKFGYSVRRVFYEMVRPSLEDIPNFPLPPGLEVRPVLPEHYRQIWDTANEAFRDHWGYHEPKEEEYQAWLNSPGEFQPHLWQIAWDTATNEIAGQVRTYINEAENTHLNYKRGYTENISVRRPWRRRGLARALIALSLQAQKDAGMTESALGVDSENLSGATRVYEDCGFRVVKTSMFYEKPF